MQDGEAISAAPPAPGSCRRPFVPIHDDLRATGGARCPRERIAVDCSERGMMTGPLRGRVPALPRDHLSRRPGASGRDADCAPGFRDLVRLGRSIGAGPGGYVDVVIGPTGVSDRDYLRIFDEQMNEVESIEIGPRGGGHVASVDFKLIIRDESVRFLWWSSNFTGAQLLERFDKIMTVLGTQLAGKLIGGITIPK